MLKGLVLTPNSVIISSGAQDVQNTETERGSAELQGNFPLHCALSILLILSVHFVHCSFPNLTELLVHLWMLPVVSILESTVSLFNSLEFHDVL